MAKVRVEVHSLLSKNMTHAGNFDDMTEASKWIDQQSKSGAWGDPETYEVKIMTITWLKRLLNRDLRKVT